MLTPSFEVASREVKTDDLFLDLDDQDQVAMDKEAQALQGRI